MCQRKYAFDTITESGNLGLILILFPMEQNHKLASSTSPLLDNGEQYRRLVGQLVYLSFTRTDLAHSIHILSQSLGALCHDH